jgi:hypothetical protein
MGRTCIKGPSFWRSSSSSVKYWPLGTKRNKTQKKKINQNYETKIKKVKGNWNRKRKQVPVNIRGYSYMWRCSYRWKVMCVEAWHDDDSYWQSCNKTQTNKRNMRRRRRRWEGGEEKRWVINGGGLLVVQ